MTPHIDEYEPRRNVPVAKCATVYTCYDGQLYLFVADQVLWFGASMPNSLINTHQIRAFGLSLCDDPWDPNREIGMDTGELFVPFYTEKWNVLFESRVPSEWELNNLHVIEQTGPHWDPLSLEMPIWPTNEAREMKSIRSLRNVASTAGTLVESCECMLEQISPAYSELNI